MISATVPVLPLAGAVSCRVGPRTADVVQQGLPGPPSDSMISLEVITVPDILIRGLSEAAVARIDAEAAALGLSRNESLRRKLEGAAPTESQAALTADDWIASASILADLADPDVMGGAWR